MRKIPTSFTIGAHTWTVKRISEKEMEARGDPDCYGTCYVDELTIYLLKPSRRIRAEILREAFWHEVAHAVLFSVSANRKLWRDENLALALGHAFKQFFDTKE